MSFSSAVARNGPKLLLLLSAWATLAQALDFDFCASLNTASMTANFSIYQTNGLCKDFCAVKKSAFAITKGKECWCSDYAPARGKQVDKGDCSQPCPGFPDEKCGGNQAYGYVSMGVPPAGTKGSTREPDPTSTSKAETATATITRTVQDTVTPSAASRSSGSLSPQTKETTSSDADKSSNSGRETAVATSVVQTVTAGGIIQTVTIIPSQSSLASDAAQTTQTRPERSRLGTGGVVGIIAAVLAMSAMALFLFFQRKNRHGNYRDDPSVRGSSSGILGGRADMSGVPGSPGSTGNRSSMLHIDPRMDPFKQGLYARSGSHESINTLRDDHDYSRRIQQPKVLRAMNPDPTDD